jgi:hypothetical protein
MLGTGNEEDPLKGRKMAALSVLAAILVALRHPIGRAFVAVTGTTVRSERR